jgi:hypothetical protein
MLAIPFPALPKDNMGRCSSSCSRGLEGRDFGDCTYWSNKLRQLLRQLLRRVEFLTAPAAEQPMGAIVSLRPSCRRATRGEVMMREGARQKKFGVLGVTSGCQDASDELDAFETSAGMPRGWPPRKKAETRTSRVRVEMQEAAGRASCT